MAKENKPKPKRAVFQPFGGIDARALHNDTRSAADIVNFRLAENGSLVKREGSHSVHSLYAPIRACWTGKLFSEQDTIILSDHEVILLQTNFNKMTLLGSIPSSSTEAQFFFYRDRLYLIDGELLYEIQENTIVAVEAYVPLIGKDWSTTSVGEIYEPRNLLSRHARIQYLVGEEPSVFLRTAYPVETVDALFLNGTLISHANYRYDDPSQSILFQGLQAGDRVTVYLTYQEASNLPVENQSPPVSCTRVNIFGDTENNRLFFWNGTQKNLFYPSRYVSEESLLASREYVSTSVPLYIPEDSSCVLGDGQYPITGFVRQYDRMLIFTSAETWMTDTKNLSDTKFVAKPINPHVGCALTNACTAWENTPVTIDQGGIYRFTADTDEYNEGNTVSICEAVRSLFSSGFLSSARVFPCRSRGELWFYTPTLDASIWIYRPSDNVWYRFSGLSILGLFEINGRIFFHNDRGIFVFDDTDREDADADGVTHEIVAEYHSHLLEYDTPEKKRFRELTVCADCDGGSFSVSLLGDRIGVIECDFSDQGSHGILSRRLSSGRFRYATLSLRAGGTAKQTVHSLISDVR